MAVCHVGEDARSTCHAAIGSGQMATLTWDVLSLRPCDYFGNLLTFVQTVLCVPIHSHL
jgi:hypothetical protein